MGKITKKLKKRRKAIDIIEDLINNDSNLLIIHYSCESFYDNLDGRTPRITSIAIRYYKTGQTKSFSIHKIAERRKTPYSEIENHYDTLELEMLTEFFNFVKQHKKYNWLHWDMRDSNYGFEAINNRFAVLGGKPVAIEDSLKFDFSRLLIDIYGVQYIEHPRLENLIEKNKISKKDFLPGKQEAEAFDNKEFVKLHQSTLRKVDILYNLLERLDDESLKTNSTLIQKYGLTPQGVFEMIKDNWLLSLIVAFFSMFIGAWISKLIE